jgi:hypothetical protein
MKLYYKYEWDDAKRQFFISRNESPHRTELSKTSRKMVAEIIMEITKKSGLSSRLGLMLLAVFFLLLLVLYLSSFFVLNNSPDEAGRMVLLAISPFICYLVYVLHGFGGGRLAKVQNYILLNEPRFKEMLAAADLDISSYFFEGSLHITSSPQR